MTCSAPNPRIDPAVAGPSAFSWQQGPRRALLQHLHHRRWSSNLRFSYQQVKMLRHDHVPDNHEPVALPRLFQNREEAVAAALRAQKRQSPVARASDKVQVMRAVGAMQSAGHNSPCYGQHRTRPCKNRKDGAPRVPERARRTRKDGPPAVSTSVVNVALLS